MKFKMLRIKNGFTQIELAEKLNVTQQLVSGWENDRFVPRSKDLKKIARALNVTVADVIDCFE